MAESAAMLLSLAVPVHSDCDNPRRIVPDRGGEKRLQQRPGPRRQHDQSRRRAGRHADRFWHGDEPSGATMRGGHAMSDARAQRPTRHPAGRRCARARGGATPLDQRPGGLIAVDLDVGVDEHQILDIFDIGRGLDRWRRGPRFRLESSFRQEFVRREFVGHVRLEHTLVAGFVTTV